MNETLSIRQEVENVVAPLVGIALADAGRAADLMWLALGQRQTIPDFQGNPREVGAYALHVQCAWRFVQGETVVAGNRDLYHPRGYKDQKEEIPKGFNWDVQGAKTSHRSRNIVSDVGLRAVGDDVPRSVRQP